MTRTPELSRADVSAIIEMALSDQTAFSTIEAEYGLGEDKVKALMRAELKPSSYRNWRARVKRFAARREHYK